jgi:hypothetical protein
MKDGAMEMGARAGASARPPVPLQPVPPMETYPYRGFYFDLASLLQWQRDMNYKWWWVKGRVSSTTGMAVWNGSNTVSLVTRIKCQSGAPTLIRFKSYEVMVLVTTYSTVLLYNTGLLGLYWPRLNGCWILVFNQVQLNPHACGAQTFSRLILHH